METAKYAETTNNYRECSANEKAPSQVMGKLRELEIVVQKIEETFSQLEERLQSVVASEPQLKENKGAEVKESLVPLAETLDTATGNIEGVYSRMVSLLDRIKL